MYNKTMMLPCCTLLQPFCIEVNLNIHVRAVSENYPAGWGWKAHIVFYGWFGVYHIKKRVLNSLSIGRVCFSRTFFMICFIISAPN